MEQGLQQTRREKNIAAWTREVQACQTSGLSVTEWCSKEGISPNTYYRHRRLVYASMNSQTEFYEVPMTTTKDTEKAAIRIHVNGLSVEIYNGADEEAIFSVLKAVKTC